MGIKLGDISPLAGAISGKGMFGKGLSKLADSGLGMLVPMSYLAKSQRDKAGRKATAAEAEAMQQAGSDAQMHGMPRRGGLLGKLRPDMADDTGMRKGGKVKKKPMATKKMAKGGSTASKRADGCATKGKTKGRFV